MPEVQLISYYCSTIAQLRVSVPLNPGYSNMPLESDSETGIVYNVSHALANISELLPLSRCNLHQDSGRWK
ncbi:hypothetical protein FRX31_007420, partial [Thalictrum thalictroides]